MSKSPLTILVVVIEGLLYCHFHVEQQLGDGHPSRQVVDDAAYLPGESVLGASDVIEQCLAQCKLHFSLVVELVAVRNVDREPNVVRAGISVSCWQHVVPLHVELG